MSIPQKRVGASILALAALALALTHVAPAHAEAYGEIARVGEFGTGPGQFHWPSAVAADPEEGNTVFVVDEPEGSAGGMGPASFRIQKFSPNLAPVKEATIPTPVNLEGDHRAIAEIAIDSSLSRLYVLKSIETPVEGYAKFAADEIDVYSTKTLTEEGVFYTFPLPELGNIPSGALGAPDGLTVEPATHDLIVLGESSSEHVAIQRIAEHSSQPEEEFVDSNGELSPSEHASGVAAGPEEGTIYVSGYLEAGAPSRGPGIAELKTTPPHSMSSPKIKNFDIESFNVPGLTGGLVGDGDLNYGAQIAVAATGGVVYATWASQEESGGTGGSYEIQGIGAESDLQQVLLGGGSQGCHISSAAQAIAAGSDGVVYVLEEGHEEGGGGSGVPSSFGYELVEFGAGGHGCPTPSASFDINKTPSGSQGTTIKKGQTATLEAQAAGLNGEIPEEVKWEIAGPAPGETFTEVSGGAGLGMQADLETQPRQYLKPGTYTITLTIVLAHNGGYGNPPPVTGTLVVEPTPPIASFEVFPSANLGEPLQVGETIEPGETVIFNAQESYDPTGSPTGTKSSTLKSYTWTFGDGTTETTESKKYKRTFANPGSSPRAEPVSLTVTNEEGISSIVPATETLTIAGTPEAKKEPETQKEPSKEAPKESPKEAPKETPKEEVKKSTPRLSNIQKLEDALKNCKKIKAKKKRAGCEKAAHQKYGATKHKKKKKKKGK
jgi:hypothetical protein